MSRPVPVLLRTVGSFDLLVTTLLAVPGLSEAFVWCVDWIGTATGLASPMPAFPPFAMFMVNLAGVLGVCWNLAILRTPTDALLRANVRARGVVVALILFYVTLRGVSPVLLIFAASEVFGALVERRELRARQASESVRA